MPSTYSDAIVAHGAIGSTKFGQISADHSRRQVIRLAIEMEIAQSLSNLGRIEKQHSASSRWLAQLSSPPSLLNSKPVPPIYVLQPSHIFASHSVVPTWSLAHLQDLSPTKLPAGAVSYTHLTLPTKLEV